MIITENLGYPRIGLKRELKTALESYWIGRISPAELIGTGQSIRKANWELQKEKGIDLIPSNDFSFYDQVLDTAVMLGAVPSRFAEIKFNDDPDAYFAMARGFQDKSGKSFPAMEMTKWFNTNYHYIVPEISPDTTFELNSKKPVNEFQEARTQGFLTKPVIIGPVSFLLLSKSSSYGFSPLTKLNDILPIYLELFEEIKQLGAEWIQLDEPFLTADLDPEMQRAYQQFFDYFEGKEPKPDILITTYFGDISANADILRRFPFYGLHIDLLNTSDVNLIANNLPPNRHLSLGIIDGRNVWRTDLIDAAEKINRFMEIYPSDSYSISPSCSLLHVPQDIVLESDISEEVQSWIAFGKQKLDELSALKSYLLDPDLSPKLFIENRKNLDSRFLFNSSNRRNVKSGDASISRDDYNRTSDFKKRKARQEKILNLPVLPTTTIGSFPQTIEVRINRSKYRKGEISKEVYKSFIKDEIEKTIRFQEEIDLDVLVHGEFERNDMVQYFAEQLEGFAFTKHGWVQSFGSRFVRPPILFGNVSRSAPMTLSWSSFAQSLTRKPVKGMLTGPVTILQWSFVRDDQPKSETCRQIAYVIRDEVLDLENAGVQIIQIDEPAFREGLPIQKKNWDGYLKWAVECFRISSSAVKDETQIHTHMCYSEFNDIIDSIAAMDADVISIEASRSNMELLDSFSEYDYPNDIGPGVYDIHSPSIPGVKDMIRLISSALQVLPAERLWINPDCGLKTRKWEEVEPALRAMVQAAKHVRENIF